MALECSYCGARTTDDAARCPSCLRATGLIAAPESPARAPLGRRARIAIALSAVAVLGGAFATRWAVTRAQRARAQELTAGTRSAEEDLTPPFARGAGIAAVDRGARTGEPLAKGRAALDALRTMIQEHAHVVLPRGSLAEGGGVPAARSIAELAAALEGRGGRFTSLDLARVLYSALDGSGSGPSFARRTSGSRPDAPPDPTGVLGRYVVLLAGHALDPLDGTVIPAAESRPRALDPGQVAGALLVQHALSLALAGDRAQGSAMIRRAIARWPDGGLPHAARAVIARAGMGDGVDESVMRDLSTAVVASGDDPGIHLLQARAAAASGDVTLARTSARAARQRAKEWGDAATAYVLAFEATSAAGGGRCDALIDAREPWTDDALTACRALTAAGAAPPESAPAAERVRQSGRDPLRWALAGAALGEIAAIPADARREYAGWLAIAGRADLADRVLNPADGGAR
jgi:hypothetical protein